MFSCIFTNWLQTDERTDRWTNQPMDGWTAVGWTLSIGQVSSIIEMHRTHLKMLIAKCLIAQLNLEVD